MTDAGHQTRLPEGLLRPGAYPWRPDRVELIETHISWVFLAGPRAVKVKRAVDFGFVDHRDPDDRRRSCEAEVRLNRRLTDGVYLGVEPVVRGADGLRLGGEGDVVEWATVMRRLPADRVLDVLLREGSVPADAGTKLADRLVGFHRGAPSCSDAPWGTAEAQADVLRENLDALERAKGIPPARQLSLVATAMRHFLAAEGPLLEGRRGDGLIRDGHGDLRAEHVCLEPDGAIQVFDCVEFSPAIRCADVASDLASLLMDLHRLGAPDLASTIRDRYLAAGFALTDRLVRLYAAHRALARAKLNVLTHPHSESHRADRRAAAIGDLDIATAATLRLRPCLIAMTGLSGTGKSTVAKRIGRVLGPVVVDSDVVRQELVQHGEIAPESRYSAAAVRRVYDALFDQARAALTEGRAALLDGTFLDARLRQAGADLAAERGVPLVFVETVSPPEVALARIERRARRGDSPSEATAEVYRTQHSRLAAAPLGLPAGAVGVTIDTADAGPADLDPLFEAIHAADVIASAIAG